VSTSDPTPQRLAQLLPELVGLLHSTFAGETLAIMQESDITMPQLVAMHVLRFRGVTSVSDLSTATRLSLSATSHLVDRLVERALVLRSEDPQDRRQKRVELSEQGAALLSRLGEARTAELTAGMSAIDPALQAQLLVAVEQTVDALKSRHARPGPGGCSPS
jgi:DNA-binding MarR family transcriptional regulator